MPDTTQLVASQVLVDMAGLDDVGILELRRIDLVAVGGDVQFFLAHQFPVVAIRRTVVHVQVVRGTQAVGGSTRAVIGDLWRTTHTALTGIVDPRRTRFLHLVEGFVHQQYTTGQTRR